MPRCFASGVGAHGEVDPVGELRARRPDLVTVDDVRVAAQLRPRRQRAEVAPRAGLREALAEDELAARDRRQQLLDERGRAEPLDRRADRLVREEIRRERQPVVAEDLLDERRRQPREPASAELDGPRHPDPSGLAERAVDGDRVAVREHPLPPPLRVALEQRPQARAEGGRVGPEGALLGCRSQVQRGRPYLG